MGWIYVISSPLTQEEMENNAVAFWEYMEPYEWTLESVAAMLGNMQAESTINPGRWQNEAVGDLDAGVGLVQWTPAEKLLNYAEWNHMAYYRGELQCSRINYELEMGLQWGETDQYPYTFQEFKVSHEDPAILADWFLKNYERPLEPNQPIRGEYALEWYEFLGGLQPKKKPGRWIYYMRKL